ncbi:MAG: hypothetical protein GX430_14785 [Treponema sp.]|nr:hypothetical protein [Treponema sp.]
MSVPEPLAEDPIAADVEKAAYELFPLFVQAENRVLRDQYAIAFANLLGNPGEFYTVVSGSAGERLVHVERLLHAFRENVELLIRKTWVEKHDEKSKEKVHEDLLIFVQEFQSGAVRKAFPHFVSLSMGIARLLFGSQAQAPDFLEYTFRIDPKLGVFYWFIGRLKEQESGEISDEIRTLELLLGVFALASF